MYNENTNVNNVSIDIDNDAMAMASAPQMGGAMPSMGPSMGSPIVEAPTERVIHRCMMHEVPHVCPINTRIVNHHIFRHTYQPRYSCCEENVCQNIQCGSCCNFM